MNDLGDPIPLSVTVKNAAGALANAGNVALTITGPTTATIVDPVAPTTIGVYEYSFTPTEPGRYGVRWVATGANASVFTDEFEVDAPSSSAIVAMQDARTHLNWLGIDTSNDEELRFHLDTASAVVEDIIGAVVRRSITTTVTPASDGALYLDDPVISITSMTAANGYVATYNIASYYPNGTRIVPSPYAVTYPYPVTVTYVAGMVIVPPQIRMAVLDLIRINWRPQQGGNYSAFDETSGEPMSMRLGYFVPRSLEDGLLRAFGRSAVA